MKTFGSLSLRFTSSKWIVALSIIVFLAVSAAWQTASPDLSSPSRFMLKPIPASAVHHAWQAPHIRNTNGTSPNWSGYAIYPHVPSSSGKGKQSTPVPTFSAVTGSWEVPEVVASDSANTSSSTWIGLDGYADNTVEQIGTAQDWSSLGPQYYAWFEMYPKWAYEIVGFPVYSGNRIAARVEYKSKGSFTLTIANLDVTDGKSNPFTFSITQRAPSAQRLSAEWIMEAPWSGGVLPLANFGMVGFFYCFATMNEYTGAINDSQWQHDAITMGTSDGIIKAVPSRLSSKGTSFSVTWRHE